MVDELKIIAEIFKSATDGALYAYLGFILYNLIKTSIIVFPLMSFLKFTVNRIFIKVDGNEK